MAALQATGALLIFRVGPVYCCAPTAPVQAIIVPPKLTRVPGSSAAGPGIFRHGGRTVRVVELRERFGVEPGDRDAVGRMVIAALRDGYLGYWVDAIGDVIPMPAQGWSALPPQIPRDIFSRALIYKEQITLYTEFERIKDVHEEHLRAHMARLKQEREQAMVRKAPVDPMPRAARRGEAPQEAERAPVESTPPPVPVKQDAPTLTPQTARANPLRVSSKPTPSRSAESGAQRTHGAIPPRPVPAARAAASPMPARKTVAPSASPPSPKPPPPRPNPTSIREPAPAINTTVADTTFTASRRDPPPPPVAAVPLRWPLWSAVLLIVAGGVGLAVVWLNGEVPQRFEHPPLVVEPSSPPASQPIAVIVPPRVTPREPPAVARAQPQEPAAVPPPQEGSTAVPDALPSPLVDDVVPAIASTASAEPELVTELPPPAASATVTISRDREGLVIEIEDRAPVTTEPETAAAAAQNSQPLETQVLPKSEDLAAAAEDAGRGSDAAMEQSAASPSVVMPPDASPPPAAAESSTAARPNASSPPSTAPKSRRRVMVVHTVVKGDTLWHIAIRYLGDPYRYPELARLSRIPNPDLIYPGDKVKIIRTME